MNTGKWSPERFQHEFEQMLSVADANGIRILFSLFENDGVPPTPENMWTTNPATALDIQSPGPDIAAPEHQFLWDKPRDFVKWFMNNYRNDPRLLAIEVMNEPHDRGNRRTPATGPFAKAMFITARSMQGSVPLTIGFDHLDMVAEFVPLGLNVIELHDNFPQSLEAFEAGITNALALGKQYNLPVWVTEWQRLRPSGSGFDNQKLTAAETLPDYASLAASVQKYPVGNFFWSLMVKRAYLQSQRAKGTVNGLFWPDGSVWSLADARAIAKDPALNFTEKKSLPPGYLDYLKPVH